MPLEVVHDRFLKIGALRSPQTDGIEFFAVRREIWPDQPGMIKHYGQLVMEEIEENTAATWRPPSFWLSMDQAGSLMDDLWAAGLRPKDYGDPAGALEPTQVHLAATQLAVNDWRGLAQRLLDQVLGDKE